MVREEEKSSQGFRIWEFGRFRQIILCRSTNKEREESKGVWSLLWPSCLIGPGSLSGSLKTCLFLSLTSGPSPPQHAHLARVAEWATAPRGGYNIQLHLHVADLEKEVNECTQESVFTMVQSYFASVFPFSWVSMDRVLPGVLSRQPVWFKAKQHQREETVENEQRFLTVSSLFMYCLLYLYFFSLEKLFFEL